MTISGRTAIKVLVVVASGIAINNLSDQFDSTAPVIIFGSLLALLGMLFYESHIDRQGATGPTGTARETLDLAKFCLASLLLGALISAVSLLPLFGNRTFTLPDKFVVFEGITEFQLYELGAASCITLLGVWAVVRRNSVVQIIAFLSSAIAGMTLAISMWPSGYVNETYEVTATFLGWLTGALIVNFIVYMAPDVIRLYAGFWFRATSSTKYPLESDSSRLPSTHTSCGPPPGGATSSGL